MIMVMSQELDSLFKGLPGRKCAFDAGAMVFTLGDPVRFVHFLREGAIHLERRQQDGAALILQRASPGSILAEASVYSDSYHCDARAEIHSVTWTVARTDLHRRLEDSPGDGLIWARHLATEVQRARLQAEILALKTVKGRLSAWMTWNGDLPEKGQWRRVANEIGVSAEALYRELAKLKGAELERLR